MGKGGKRADGFTLIELMIVVAIIGLLAAIAIPKYQQYVAKSQVSEAESMLRDMRQDIELHITREGEYPAAKSDIKLRSRPDSGAMVISTGLSKMGSSTGTINAVFGTNVSPMLSGRKLVYERASGGAWSCVPPSGGDTDVPVVLLPDNCN